MRMKLALTLCASLAAWPAVAHDIYSGLKAKGSYIPCCGGESAGAARDCWPTVYREAGSHFQFRLNSGDWIEVPTEEIQFVPIPGDKVSDDSHAAHICYRDDPQSIENYHEHGNADRLRKTLKGAEVVLYCSFIPPGGL